MVLALPADRLLATEEVIDLKGLAEEPFVAYPGSGVVRVRNALMRGGEAAGFHPHVAQAAPDSYAILSLVAAGVGVSFLEKSVQHINFPGPRHRRGVLPTPAT